MLAARSNIVSYPTITFPSGMSLAGSFPTLAENAGIDLSIQLVLQNRTNILSNNQVVAAITNNLYRLRDGVAQMRPFDNNYDAVIKPTDEFYVISYDDELFASEFGQVENVETAITNGADLANNVKSFSASFSDGTFFVWRLRTIAQTEDYGFFCLVFKKVGDTYSFRSVIRVVSGTLQDRDVTGTWTYYVNIGDKLAFYKLV